MEKRCLGCMKRKFNSPVCEHCGYDERSRNETDRLPVGMVLRDRYQIGKTLGQGGFGITYIGWDKLLDIAVAVKEYFPRGIVMRDCTLNTKVHCYTNLQEEYEKSKDRFLREAKTLAKFMHIPEIVRVQDFFEENNTAYIVMEYVDGINLHQYMRRCGGRLSAEQTLTLLKPVMEALIQVHKANIVHRDISPDNIMILDGGRTKLLDFGAVREVEHPDAQGMLTHSTQTILKRGFAPVEQYRSRGGLGPWTDVYALCATIYCCITGQVPVESQELLMEEDRIHWEHVPGLSEQQRKALQQGTELLPNKRLKSVEELYHALYRQQQARNPEPPIYTAPVWQNMTGGVTQPVKPDPGKEPQKPVKEPKQPVKVPPVKPVDQKEIPRKESAPSPSPKKKGKGIAIMAALIVLVFAWVQISGQKALERRGSSAMQGTMANTPELTGDISQDNVLMEAPNIDRFTSLEKRAKESAFKTKAKRGEVNTITFLSDTSNAPLSAKDVSEKGNGAVKAWAEKNGNLYDLYIAADGGVFAPENSSCLFSGMQNLTDIRFGGAFSTENVTNMSDMFSDCKSLRVLDLDCFDTSKVTNMWSMFEECESLTTLNMSSMDTSNVTGMRYMFYHCKSLTELDVSHFNTTNVTDMMFMFTNCDNLTKLNVSNWDTSNVEEMGWLFGNCYKLAELDVSSWNTAKAEDMSHMFYCGENLTALNLSGWDTANVTDMSGMFGYCYSLTALNVQGWNTANVTDMMGMFQFCESLETLDLSSFETTSVRNMQNMFYGCEKLNNLNIRSFSVHKDTVTSQMFNNCPAKTSLAVSE